MGPREAGGQSWRGQPLRRAAVSGRAARSRTGLRFPRSPASPGRARPRAHTRGQRREAAAAPAGRAGRGGGGQRSPGPGVSGCGVWAVRVPGAGGETC